MTSVEFNQICAELGILPYECYTCTCGKYKVVTKNYSSGVGPVYVKIAVFLFDSANLVFRMKQRTHIPTGTTDAKFYWGANRQTTEEFIDKLAELWPSRSEFSLLPLPVADEIFANIKLLTPPLWIDPDNNYEYEMTLYGMNVIHFGKIVKFVPYPGQ